MAYNSDGYIMIDFTEVDFRRTNQTIEGLYKRCVDVIGTNKFILVINANGRTPLPATCSFTNNQYVIDTCIYMFAISSNDNLFIRRNDVPASDIIDDNSISVDKTWSSNKIDTELDGKADTSALANYQPLLTAGTNITIDENNVISSTGGAVIDDTVIVNNKVWSSLNTVENLAPIDTVINNPVTFNTSLALPLVECDVVFSATQAIGTPTPQNPIPIVGVSSLDVVVNGSTISKSLEDTYYGGVLNVLTGVLTITRRFITLNGSETITVNSNYIKSDACDGYVNIRHTTEPLYTHDIEGYTSDKLVIKPTTVIWSNVGYPNTWRLYRHSIAIVGLHFNIANDLLGIVDYTQETTETVKAKLSSWLNSNTPSFVIELYTPLTIQLTPEQITTIIGSNTISTTGDTLKVSYKYLPIDLL